MQGARPRAARAWCVSALVRQQLKQRFSGASHLLCCGALELAVRLLALQQVSGRERGCGGLCRGAVTLLAAAGQWGADLQA